MAIAKYTLYKYVKVDGAWRYCKAAEQTHPHFLVLKPIKNETMRL